MKDWNFRADVENDLTKAREKHGVQSSCHEGYAILFEEVEEFWEEVRRKHSERDWVAMYKELVQVAACAQKTAEDVVIPMIKKTNQG